MDDITVIPSSQDNMYKRYRKSSYKKKPSYGKKRKMSRSMKSKRRRTMNKRRMPSYVNQYAFQSRGNMKFARAPKFSKLRLVPHRSQTSMAFLTQRTTGTEGTPERSNALCFSLDVIGNKSVYISTNPSTSAQGPDQPYSAICDFGGSVVVGGQTYSGSAPVIQSGYDCYHPNVSGFDENYPYGLRRIYHTSSSIKITFVNPNEQAITCRISVFKLRRNISTHEWQKQFEFPQNRTHYKIYKTDTFLLNPTSIGSGSGIQTFQKDYTFPIKKWKTTSRGDPSGAFIDWINSNPQGRYWFMIETNDMSASDNQVALIKVVKTDYWSSVEGTST